MSEKPDETGMTQAPQPADFDRITSLVSTEFQVEEALVESNIPTFYLKHQQETKQSFLRLLANLEPMNLMAFLRKRDGRIVLKVLTKPSVKPSNILVNWVLFFATIATTFGTGYILSGDMLNPLVGGAMFTIAIMTVLGAHEMGHKLTANRKGIEATPPYFIPGPPPVGGLLGIGTFGAVIMQKSLPPNRDALFDVGASGPIVGFALASIASVVGLLMSPIHPITQPDMNFLPAPLFFDLFITYVTNLPTNYYIQLHPIAFAGWVGMIVTMLNLLPAAMLDGGHVARSLIGEKARLVFTILSFGLLVVEGFIPMAIFVLFLSMYKHPGPLDDVSPLSTGRKVLTVGLVAILVLCSYLHYYFLYVLQLLLRF